MKYLLFLGAIYSFLINASESPLLSVQQQIEKLTADSTLKNRDKTLLREEIVRELDKVLTSSSLSLDQLTEALTIAQNPILSVGDAKQKLVRLVKNINEAINRQNQLLDQEEANRKLQEERRKKEEENREIAKKNLEDTLDKFFDSVSDTGTSAVLSWPKLNNLPEEIVESAVQKIENFLKTHPTIENFRLIDEEAGAVSGREKEYRLRVLTALPSQLAELNLATTVSAFPDFSNFSMLKKLKLRSPKGCLREVKLPASIEELDISGACVMADFLDEVLRLNNLKMINIAGAQKMSFSGDDTVTVKYYSLSNLEKFQEDLMKNNPGIKIIRELIRQ